MIDFWRKSRVVDLVVVMGVIGVVAAMAIPLHADAQARARIEQCAIRRVWILIEGRCTECGSGGGRVRHAGHYSLSRVSGARFRGAVGTPQAVHFRLTW